MKTLKSTSSIFMIAAVVALSFSSCKKDDPAPATLSAATFSNLNADYAPMVVGAGGQPTYPTAKNKFTFFSLSTGNVVANADSATTKWDIGFRSTTIIVNGGTSGPGNAAAIVQTGIFSDLTVAPTTGYAQDNKNATVKYAIPTGSGNGWYTYNLSTNIITPTAGKFLVIKTADGKYAKVEIISYYKDAPTTPTTSSLDRYYTFRYVYQGDGSTKLN
jgi:hypothetical protein